MRLARTSAAAACLMAKAGSNESPSLSPPPSCWFADGVSAASLEGESAAPEPPEPWPLKLRYHLDLRLERGEVLVIGGTLQAVVGFDGRNEVYLCWPGTPEGGFDTSAITRVERWRAHGAERYQGGRAAVPPLPPVDHTGRLAPLQQDDDAHHLGFAPPRSLAGVRRLADEKKLGAEPCPTYSVYALTPPMSPKSAIHSRSLRADSLAAGEEVGWDSPHRALKDALGAPSRSGCAHLRAAGVLCRLNVVASLRTLRSALGLFLTRLAVALAPPPPEYAPREAGRGGSVEASVAASGSATPASRSQFLAPAEALAVPEALEREAAAGSVMAPCIKSRNSMASSRGPTPQRARPSRGRQLGSCERVFEDLRITVPIVKPPGWREVQPLVMRMPVTFDERGTKETMTVKSANWERFVDRQKSKIQNEILEAMENAAKEAASVPEAAAADAGAGGPSRSKPQEDLAELEEMINCMDDWKDLSRYSGKSVSMATTLKGNEMRIHVMAFAEREDGAGVDFMRLSYKKSVEVRSSSRKDLADTIASALRRALPFLAPAEGSPEAEEQCIRLLQRPDVAKYTIALAFRDALEDDGIRIAFSEARMDDDGCE